MKLARLIILTLIFSLSFFNETNAQFLKKLKSKVQKAAEDAVIDKAAQKANQETGKVMDSLLDIDPNYQSKTQEQDQNMLLQGGDSIPINDLYTFNTNVIYQMNYTNDNKPSTIDYSMWFSDHENYMASEIININSEKSKENQVPKGMINIIDENNQVMIVIMEEQKIAQVISMNKIKNIDIEEKDKNQSPETDLPKINKTGKSKKILGYLCEEYTSQTDERNMSFWITKDVKLHQKNMFLNMSKSLGGNTFQNVPNAAKGFMMEMHYENKSDGENGTMVVTAINKKTKSINTKNYQMMNLSGFMQK